MVNTRTKPLYEYTRPANENALIDFRNDIEAACEEITQHTSNAFEAFEQWREERAALMELFAEAEQQDKLLRRVKDNAAVIKRLLYGRRPMTGPPTVKPENVQKLIEIIDSLTDFGNQAEAVLKDRAETMKQYRQLGLFER